LGTGKWPLVPEGLEMPGMLDDARRARYSRQLPLLELGEGGQERLLASSVLVVGAGGLGSAAALYLAAAGVGTLGIADGDRVEVSNLHRQILHRQGTVGWLKVDSAAEAIARLNPDVRVVRHPERLTAANAVGIMARYDVVVAGVDDFPTRYLINDVSLNLRKPVVHASVLRFEGQLTVVLPYGGPCYRCLFPEPPPSELAPSSVDAGILGAVAGVIGSAEAAEAIKLVLGIGDPLAGRLFSYDALSGEVRMLTVHRDPRCAACGEERRPPPVVDYGRSCLPASPEYGA
jgi:molybdopterin/thiamine biosynthesis adenylyltransferase